MAGIKVNELQQKCLVPFCDNRTIHIRGLCKTCYLTMAQMVHRKKTTYERLEKDGKILPKKRRSRTFLQEWFINGTIPKKYKDRKNNPL